ncbi:MAG: hypothetical protein WKF34_14370 [Pyrinomonadaceae bacterium]
MKTFFLALLSLFAFNLTTDAQVPSAAAATWQVQKYDLNVTLPSDASRVVPIKASLTLKNVSGRPASTLTLRIAPMADVTAIKVNESTVEFTKSEEKVNAGTTLQRIGIRLTSIPPDGLVSAVLDYKLTVKDNSALASLTPNSAQFLPLSFWYPTPNSWFFVRGADMANVSIKVAPRTGQAVVAAGMAAGDGTYSSKLLGQPFFVSGELGRVEPKVNGVDVFAGNLGAEQKLRAADLAKIYSDAFAYVSTLLGKGPDVPLTIVTSRRGAGFGGGGLVVVDEAVLRRSKVDSLTVMNLAEAAAKIWLGSAVSVNGEGYGVISEGLARYLATQFVENKYGKDVADIERLRQRNAYAAVSKRDAPMANVSPLDDFYYPEVANKGAMAWRILARRLGTNEFSDLLKKSSQDGNLNLAELRLGLSAQKELVDYLFDSVTDANLLVGLPRPGTGETRVAVRNTSATDVSVDVAATTATGERIVSPTTIKALSIGDVGFKTASKIARVEIDVEKLYPQTDYSDDVQPRESTDSDPLLAAKRLFDKQDFAGAERTAKTLLRDLPRFDDLRVLLGRALLAQNKTLEAEKEFRAVIDEKLPTARSLAWANVGLADIAIRANQNDAAAKYIETVLAADAEYGASLAARNLRKRSGTATAVDPSIRTFFADFDKAATANRKADIDAMVMPGEVTRFASGVAGSTENWQTQITAVDRLDANTVLVETAMTVKLLNKNSETGMAVYRLTKVGGSWKLSAVEVFEVR